MGAQANHWRTGYYDADGVYVPNTNEQRFLRCPTAACEGGPLSACTNGMGPVCGTCTGAEVFDLGLMRCSECQLGTAVYILIYLGYTAVQTLILLVLVMSVRRSRGRSPNSFAVGLRLTILWVQVRCVCVCDCVCLCVCVCVCV